MAGSATAATRDYLCDRPAERRGQRPAPTSTRRIKDNGFVHRLNADLEAERRHAVLRDLVARLPARRHQPPRHLAALRADFLTNYEAGAKISFGRGSHFNVAVYQRGLERHPAVLPRRQRPDRDPQRRQRPHPRLRGRPVPAADGGPDLEHRRVVQRCQDAQRLLLSTTSVRLLSTPGSSATISLARTRATRCRLPRNGRAAAGSATNGTPGATCQRQRPGESSRTKATARATFAEPFSDIYGKMKAYSRSRPRRRP